jgi:hypothetical protein
VLESVKPVPLKICLQFEVHRPSPQRGPEVEGWKVVEHPSLTVPEGPLGEQSASIA